MKALLGGGLLIAAATVAGSLAPDLASAQVDVSGDRPLAGEYRAKITFLSLDMPGAPPQMAEMMGQMMSRDINYCLTEEDIAEGYRAITNRTSQDGAECEYERFNYSGGQIDAAMVCNVDGRAMRMEMQGTGSPTSSDITMTMSGDFGMGDGSMSMRAQHERLGACS